MPLQPQRFASGQVAEAEGRTWLTFEAVPEYVAASAFRFLDKGVNTQVMDGIYKRILAGETVDLEAHKMQEKFEFASPALFKG